MPKAANAGSDRSSTVALGMLFTIYFFSSIDRSIFGILAQPVKEELLLADWQLGFLTGFAFSAVQLVFGLPMARLADKWNRVKILSICITFWSLMTGFSGLCTNFLQLTFARMGVGVGEAACLPASHSLISDYFPPDRRTKALAIFGLGYPGGALLGMIMGGVVLDHWGWRAAFGIVGFPGLLVALLAWRIMKEPPRGQLDVAIEPAADLSRPVPYGEVIGIMWRSPVLRQMIIALVVLTVFTSPTATFLGPFLARKFPISYTQRGFIMAMTMMLGASISTYGGGVIAQRLARRDQRWLMWFPGLTVVLGAPLYVISLAQPTWQWLAVWMFLGALANATFLAPSYTVLHNAIPPGGRAKAVVVVSIIMGLIGFSLGPLLAGLANDLVASYLFKGLGGLDFMTTCPGGEAAKGASAAVAQACHSSMVRATQLVMLVTMAITVWPGLHFYLAGKHMPKRR